MLATEEKHVFMFKGKQHEVLKLIYAHMNEGTPVAAVVSINEGRVFILNRDYPGLVTKKTCEVHASFKNHLSRVH